MWFTGKKLKKVVWSLIRDTLVVSAVRLGESPHCSCKSAHRVRSFGQILVRTFTLPVHCTLPLLVPGIK